MSFQQLISIIRARWLVLATALGLTVVTAVVISLLLPKQYTATASVVIDSKSPDPITGMVTPGLMMPGYIATQMDVLTSERVIQKAIESLQLDKSPQLRAQWTDATKGNGSFDSWLADALARGIEIKPSRESSVINISYTAVDPKFAAAIANALVQGYIDTTLELRTEPAKQFNKLFDEQSKHARERLEQAQNRLSEYQKEKGLTTTDERLDVETMRLNELNAQLVAMQSQTADANSRRAQAGANSPDVIANPVIADLKADLSRQQAKLKELTSRLGTAHPQVVELQANITELRARIEGEARNVNASMGINSSINQQREAQVRAALEAQRLKVLKLKDQRDEATVLIRDVENAQKNYDSIQARYSQSNLESQSNQTNVSVLKVATPPVKPSGPKVLLNTVLAIFAGAILGLIGVFSLEITDRRLRSEADVTALLGASLLGTMPSVKGASGADTKPVRISPRVTARRSLPELNAPAKS